MRAEPTSAAWRQGARGRRATAAGAGLAPKSAAGASAGRRPRGSGRPRAPGGTARPPPAAHPCWSLAYCLAAPSLPLLRSPHAHPLKHPSLNHARARPPAARALWWWAPGMGGCGCTATRRSRRPRHRWGPRGAARGVRRAMISLPTPHQRRLARRHYQSARKHSHMRRHHRPNIHNTRARTLTLTPVPPPRSRALASPSPLWT